MSVYSVSENDFSLQNALVDPALTLELPAGVTVTRPRDLSGGLTAPVPLPDSVKLLASGVAVLLSMGCIRRRSTPTSSTDAEASIDADTRTEV